MIDCQVLFEHLKKSNVQFFCGVPDSLLKHPCAYMADNFTPEEHIITANEGNAVAMATGYHLSTGNLSLVYLQNSGLGNTINPLLSLADPSVYSIPMVLLMGWRGEPGAKDEPQHQKQGIVCEQSLANLEIPYKIISADSPTFEKDIVEICQMAKEQSRPTCLLVRKNTFNSYPLKAKKKTNECQMSRESAIEKIVESLPSKAVVVSTTGKSSRELYEIRKKKKQSHQQDFLTVGSMGHASSIALAIAIHQKERPVFCLDGDGALLMHMGNLGLIGQFRPAHFYHIVVNNSAHESVGGQPTCAPYLNFKSLADGFGYNTYHKIKDLKSIEKTLNLLRHKPGPHFIEVVVQLGSRKDLGRPTNTPLENKKLFMDFLQNEITD